MQTVSPKRFIAALIFLLAASAAAPASAQDRLENLGATYDTFLQTQDPEQAIALGSAALASAAKTTAWTLSVKREAFLIAVHSGLGRAYVNRAGGVRADNIEAAIEHFSAALASATNATPAEEIAAIHTNLAVAYWNRMRGERVDSQDRSLSHFESALSTFTRDSRPLEWAQINLNMGALYLTRLRGDRASNTEKSIACLKDALLILKRESQPQLWAAAHSNLGNAYRGRTAGLLAENLDAANLHLGEALKVFKRETSPVQWAQVEISLASVLQRKGGSQAEADALAKLQGVLTVFTRDSFPQQWAQTQYEVGNALADKKSGNIAAQRQQAIAAYDAAATVLTLEAAPLQHLQVSRRLANVMMEIGDCKSAKPWHASARQAFRLLFNQSLDQTETANLAAEGGPMFADAAFCAAERGEIKDAARLANEGRARVLAVSLKLQPANASPERSERIAALRVAIRAEQAALDAATGVERAAAADRLHARRQDLLQIVEQAGASEPSGCAGHADQAANVRRAIVMPVVTVRGSKILLCGGDATSWTVIDYPGITLSLIAGFLADRSSDGRPGWIEAYFANYFQGEEQARRWPQWLDAVDTIGPKLWDLFGAKLEQALRANRIAPGTQLVLMPSGRLGVLPLGLAQDPSSKQRLIDRYEIVYAPSLEALDSARRLSASSKSATLAAVVNPTGDLPGAEKEGAIVASHFSNDARTVLKGGDATIPAVLAALRGKAYWHFATHGTFAWQDVSSSALIMAPADRLSVGRLAQADGLGQPRLVVLSACETGLTDIVTGNPDEFIGLPGSFAALGAAGVLGTLWPVADDATALLIAKFYELHIGQGMTPPAALRSAQLWLRDASAGDIERFAASQKLEARHVAEIRQAIGRLSTRMGGVSNPGTNGRDRKTTTDTGTQEQKPYAHPYYWGGFVYTGL